MIDSNRYLLDNNVLIKLSQAQREGAFVHEFCRIPSEVFHEADGIPGIHDLSELEYPFTVGVALALRTVIATVPVGETKLVDLYRNRGNADPILIACAIDGAQETAKALFGHNWIVVSDDHAVQTKAREFEIDVCSSIDFIGVLMESDVLNDEDLRVESAQPAWPK